MQKSVPVVDYNQIPLMPTSPARAAKWIKSGKATPFWKKGVFCVRLNQLTYVGGEMVKPTKKQPDRKVISLHSVETGKR